jgi:hypothetical protein
MSRRAIEALRDFREVNLYLRGIIPQLGFASAIVQYDRGDRFAARRNIRSPRCCRSRGRA